MKLLPCENCRGQGAMLSNGRPYISGRAPVHPARIQCHRCKRTTTITASMWNRQRDLTADELEDMGFLDFVAKDFTLGGALSMPQARDLVRLGLTLAEAHRLVRTP